MNSISFLGSVNSNKSSKSHSSNIWNVNSLSKWHVSRAEDILKVDELLTNNPTVVIVGSSGVGKTELVVEYCRHENASKYNAVNWINASTNYSIQECFKELLHHIGFKIEGGVDMSNILEQLYKHYFGKKVLFILDNVTEESIVLDIISCAKLLAKTEFKFLITSEINYWTIPIAKHKLTTCRQDRILELMKNEIPTHLYDVESATDIIVELNSHVLPVQIANYCMTRYDISSYHYCILLKNKSSNYHDKYDNDTYYKSLTVVLIVLIDQMEDENDKVLLQLAHVCSYLDGAKIEKSMLVHHLGLCRENKDSLVELFETLEKFPFIKVDRTSRENKHSIRRNSDSNRGNSNAYLTYYSMHDLVQLCFKKDLLDVSNKFMKTSHDDSAYIFQILVMFDKLRTTTMSRTWVHHVVYIFQQCYSNETIQCVPINDAIKAHITSAEYNTALCILQSKLDIENSKSAHIATMYTKYLIAYCLRAKGNYENAIKCFQELHDIRKNGLGINHVETLSTFCDIALCYQYNGEYEDAIQIYREIYEEELTLYGEDHAKTLKTYEKIAFCLTENGDLDEAIRMYKNIHELQTRKLGSDHTETLTTYSTVACCMQDKGYYEDANRIFRYIHEVRKKRLGLTHPDTLSIRHNEALCLQSKGHFKEALKIYQEIYEVQIELLGREHFDTLITYYNIGLCMQGVKCYEEAIEIFQNINKIQQNILGLDYDVKLKTLYYIAICLRESGKYKDALKTYQELLIEQKENLGLHHTETLLTFESIAQCLQDLGDFESSLCVYEEVHEILKSVLGEDHLDTLYSYNNIALCHQHLGNREKAMNLLTHVYNKQRTILGEQHLDSLISLHNIALCMQEKENYKEAIEIFQEVYETQRLVLGMDHFETIIAYYNIAICYQGLLNYDQAIEIYQDITNTLGNSSCSNQSIAYDSLHNMGLCYQEKGDFERALELFRQVYSHQREMLGEHHKDTLTTYCDIGHCLRAQGDVNVALEIFKEVSGIQKCLFGDDHPETLMTLGYIESWDDQNRVVL